MVTDADAVLSVARDQGMLAALAPGAIWAQMSTSGVEGPRLGEDPDRGMEAYDRRGTDRTWHVIDAVQKIAEERGVSMAEVALAWVTARPAVSSTILGARTISQLETNLRAARLHLTAAQTAMLDAASDPHPADYPYGELGVEQRSRILPAGH